jgi:hypothetical protein
MGSYSEERLRNRVSEGSRTQKQMKLVLAAPEGEERRRLLTPHGYSDISQAREFAVQELGKLGLWRFQPYAECWTSRVYKKAPDLIEAMV